mmetsp:Transcript_207/g.249  ORF Transcript_207/g.249 Transcript_207/m.249 type:complete len:100 (+) Transcript_207:784-1083(+)
MLNSNTNKCVIDTKFSLAFQEIVQIRQHDYLPARQQPRSMYLQPQNIKPLSNNTAADSGSIKNANALYRHDMRINIHINEISKFVYKIDIIHNDRNDHA